MQLYQLSAILTRAPAVRLQRCLPYLNSSMVEAEINTNLRISMYIAQLAEETDEFRYLQEVWGPTVQQKKYDPPSDLAAKLGNTEPGEGPKFLGRGAIMITGKKNYAKAAADLGLPLLTMPEIASTPPVAFRIAAWYWKDRNLNTFADKGDLEGCTREINGGLYGLDTRRAYYVVALKVLPPDFPVTTIPGA